MDNLTGEEVYVDIRAVGMNFKVGGVQVVCAVTSCRIIPFQCPGLTFSMSKLRVCGRCKVHISYLAERKLIVAVECILLLDELSKGRLASSS